MIFLYNVNINVTVDYFENKLMSVINHNLDRD